MGHLTSVANALVQNSEKGPNAEQLQQLLKGEDGACLGAGGAGGASVLTFYRPFWQSCRRSCGSAGRPSCRAPWRRPTKRTR